VSAMGMVREGGGIPDRVEEAGHGEVGCERLGAGGCGVAGVRGYFQSWCRGLSVAASCLKRTTMGERCNAEEMHRVLVALSLSSRRAKVKPTEVNPQI
jgi:hypothetical protein